MLISLIKPNEEVRISGWIEHPVLQYLLDAKYFLALEGHNSLPQCTLNALGQTCDSNYIKRRVTSKQTVLQGERDCP